MEDVAHSDPLGASSRPASIMQGPHRGQCRRGSMLELTGYVSPLFTFIQIYVYTYVHTYFVTHKTIYTIFKFTYKITYLHLYIMSFDVSAFHVVPWNRIIRAGPYCSYVTRGRPARVASPYSDRSLPNPLWDRAPVRDSQLGSRCVPIASRCRWSCISTIIIKNKLFLKWIITINVNGNFNIITSFETIIEIK